MTKTSRPKPLTDTALVMLGQAAQRNDGWLLPLPQTLKAGSAQIERTITGLLKKGLLEEVATADSSLVWRQDADGLGLTLRMTSHGLRAMGGLEPEERPQSKDKEDGQSQSGKPKVSKKSRTRASARGVSDRPTKQDAVLRLLRRKSGASLDELMDATAWQAHSVRGFLSGTVRKKLGLSLMSEKNKSGQRRYKIEDHQPTV